MLSFTYSVIFGYALGWVYYECSSFIHIKLNRKACKYTTQQQSSKRLERYHPVYLHCVPRVSECNWTVSGYLYYESLVA